MCMQNPEGTFTSHSVVFYNLRQKERDGVSLSPESYHTLHSMLEDHRQTEQDCDDDDHVKWKDSWKSDQGTVHLIKHCLY